MPAFVLAEVKVNDPEAYQKYIDQVPATIEAHGGRYLARGGEVEILDAHRSPERLVIVEFESMERAREWWNSEVYQGPKAIREAAAVSRIVLLDGLG